MRYPFARRMPYVLGMCRTAIDPKDSNTLIWGEVYELPDHDKIVNQFVLESDGL